MSGYPRRENRRNPVQLLGRSSNSSARPENRQGIRRDISTEKQPRPAYGRSQSQTRRACFLTASYPRKALRAHPKLAALREITWQYACTMAVTASATRMRSRLSQGCRRAPTGSVARLTLPRGAFFHRMRTPAPPQAPQRHSRIPAKVGLAARESTSKLKHRMNPGTSATAIYEVAVQKIRRIRVKISAPMLHLFE